MKMHRENEYEINHNSCKMHNYKNTIVTRLLTHFKNDTRGLNRFILFLQNKFIHLTINLSFNFQDNL